MALFVLINLPRDKFASLVEQLMNNLETLTTSVVFDRLITESQMMASETESSLAMNSKSKQPSHQKDLGKGDRSSSDPNALCCQPRHQFSMHTNAECRMKPDFKKPPSKKKPGVHLKQSSSVPTSATANMSIQDKADWFDRAHAANVATVEESDESSEDEETVVHLANAYSASVIRAIKKSKADIVDSGTDRDIFNDKSRFISLHPIRPVTIRSANGADDMRAIEAGAVNVNTYDKKGVKHKMIIENVLYCEKVTVNLISAIRLCDTSFDMHANAVDLTFNNTDGRQIHASRVANTANLWTTSVSKSDTVFRHKINAKSATVFNAKADLMHQRLGHIHSSALRRFCGHGLTNKCTSCVMAKAHR